MNQQEIFLFSFLSIVLLSGLAVILFDLLYLSRKRDEGKDE